MTTADRYRRWFEYEKDSHAKVLQSLHAVSEHLRSSTEFQKSLTLLAHIVAARQIWLFRFGIAKEAPKDFFPQRVDLHTLSSDMASMQQAWWEHLAKLNDADLARTFEYRSMEGERFRSTVEDVLTQLYGHSLYHRGQIAALIRSIGAEPAVTDFVFWAREPVAAR